MAQLSQPSSRIREGGMTPQSVSRRQGGADRTGELGGDVGDQQVAPVPDHVAAVDDDGADVGGRGGEDRGLQGQVAGGTGGPPAVEGYGDQVRPGAGGERA